MNIEQSTIRKMSKNIIEYIEIFKFISLFSISIFFQVKPNLQVLSFLFVIILFLWVIWVPSPGRARRRMPPHTERAQPLA